MSSSPNASGLDTRFLDVLGLRIRIWCAARARPCSCCTAGAPRSRPSTRFVTGLAADRDCACAGPARLRSERPAPASRGAWRTTRRFLAAFMDALRDRASRDRGPLKRRAHRDQDGRHRTAARLAARARRLRRHSSQAHHALLPPGGDGQARQVRRALPWRAR